MCIAGWEKKRKMPDGVPTFRELETMGKPMC